MSNTLTHRALALKARSDELKEAGMIERMSKGPALAEDLAGFMVDLAAQVDALTPYIDEGAET